MHNIVWVSTWGTSKLGDSSSLPSFKTFLLLDTLSPCHLRVHLTRPVDCAPSSLQHQTIIGNHNTQQWGTDPKSLFEACTSQLTSSKPSSLIPSHPRTLTLRYYLLKSEYNNFPAISRCLHHYRETFDPQDRLQAEKHEKAFPHPDPNSQVIRDWLFEVHEDDR